jgi:hypothetical protein
MGESVPSHRVAALITEVPSNLSQYVNDLMEIGSYFMNWIDLAQDRNQWRALVNMVMNLRVP